MAICFTTLYIRLSIYLIKESNRTIAVQTMLVLLEPNMVLSWLLEPNINYNIVDSANLLVWAASTCSS